MKNVLSTLVLFFLFYSCTYRKFDDMKPVTPSNNNVAVSYSATIKPILITYCLGTGSQTCHVTVSNQGASGDFTNYTGLKSKVTNGTIQSRVFMPGGGMPPTYSSGPTNMTAADLQKFKDWVNQGSLNN